MGRDWRALVDGQDLLTLIAAQVGRGNWPEVKQAALNCSSVISSAKAPGAYDIIICGHCAVNDFVSSADLRLKPVVVTHSDEYIEWHVVGDPSLWANQSPLLLRFHKPQYRQAIATLGVV